jgi:TPR repeat protein
LTRHAICFATALIFFSLPAFAEEAYNAGYNAGYYGGAQPQSEGSRYGAGYEDGIYDAEQDDAAARKRSEDFEDALSKNQVTNTEENGSDLKGDGINTGGQVSDYEKHPAPLVKTNDTLFKLAEAGDPTAQYELGLKYWAAAYIQELEKQNGVLPSTEPIDGIRRDYFEAASWFRKAAEQGNEAAQDSLGQTYRDGKGVTQDYAEALKWFNKSVHNGMGSAEYNLGTLYENGWGVPKNYVTAQMWYILAALPHTGRETVDRSIVAKDRARLSSKMTPEQRSEAQKLAQEWTPK